jgi:PASTA domain-containing protein
VGTVTFQASTTVAAGNVISESPVAGTSVPPGSAVNLVVSLGNAPTIATLTTHNNATPNTTNTTASFSVAANTLLVAFVSTDAPATGTNTTVNRIDTLPAAGGALTWTRAARANVQRGTAEIWWALVPNARSMQITAVLNFSETSSVTVVGVTGGANTMVGAASVIANGALNSNTFPNASLTTTRANSWVFGVGVDWDAAHVMVPGAGQTMVSQFQTPNGDSYWVQRTTNAVAVAGTPTTINVTYPGATHPDRWNLALIEVRQP